MQRGRRQGSMNLLLASLLILLASSQAAGTQRRGLKKQAWRQHMQSRQLQEEVADAAGQKQSEPIQLLKYSSHTSLAQLLPQLKDQEPKVQVQDMRFYIADVDQELSRKLGFPQCEIQKASPFVARLFDGSHDRVMTFWDPAEEANKRLAEQAAFIQSIGAKQMVASDASQATHVLLTFECYELWMQAFVSTKLEQARQAMDKEQPQAAEQYQQELQAMVWEIQRYHHRAVQHLLESKVVGEGGAGAVVFGIAPYRVSPLAQVYMTALPRSVWMLQAAMGYVNIPQHYQVIPRSSPQFADEVTPTKFRNLILAAWGPCERDGTMQRTVGRRVLVLYQQHQEPSEISTCTDNHQALKISPNVLASSSLFCLILPDAEESNLRLTEALLYGCIPAFAGPQFQDLVFEDIIDYRRLGPHFMLSPQIMPEPVRDSFQEMVDSSTKYYPNAVHINDLNDIPSYLGRYGDDWIEKAQAYIAEIQPLLRYRLHAAAGSATDPILRYIAATSTPLQHAKQGA